jgi:hypothetical protein
MARCLILEALQADLELQWEPLVGRDERIETILSGYDDCFLGFTLMDSLDTHALGDALADWHGRISVQLLLLRKPGLTFEDLKVRDDWTMQPDLLDIIEDAMQLPDVIPSIDIPMQLQGIWIWCDGKEKLLDDLLRVLNNLNILPEQTALLAKLYEWMVATKSLLITYRDTERLKRRETKKQRGQDTETDSLSV